MVVPELQLRRAPPHPKGTSLARAPAPESPPAIWLPGFRRIAQLGLELRGGLRGRRQNRGLKRRR